MHDLQIEKLKATIRRQQGEIVALAKQVNYYRRAEYQEKRIKNLEAWIDHWRDKYNELLKTRSTEDEGE